MKTFRLTGEGTSRTIECGDDEMIVYDIIKIADYEKDDYEPRDQVYKQDKEKSPGSVSKDEDL